MSEVNPTGQIHTLRRTEMTKEEFNARAAVILHNMALERQGFWRQMFRRWHISHEPLRHDAANLLREAGVIMLTPVNCELVGGEDD